MSDSPIRDALNKPIEIPDLPPDSVTIAGEVKQNGDAGATIGANVGFDPGKKGGWTGTVGAAASIWKSTGAAIKAWITLKKSVLFLLAVIASGCATVPYVPGPPHPTPDEISALARIHDVAKALQAIVPFSIRLTPQIVMAGSAIRVRCYVPWSMGDGRIRYGIPGIRESDQPLTNGAEYLLLVERISCGRWVGRCVVSTREGVAVREQPFDVAGCDGSSEK